MTERQELDLSNDQWELLTTLFAIGGSASIDLVNDLAPLSASDLIDLHQKGERSGWLENTVQGNMLLCDAVPASIRAKLADRCTRPFSSKLLKKIERNDLWDSISLKSRANLLSTADRIEEAALLEHRLGNRALESGSLGQALDYFERIFDRLSDRNRSHEGDSLFISSIFELSNLRFCSGKGIGEIPDLLNKARQIARRRGDTRSLTLIKLHLGRYSSMRGTLDETLSILKSGLEAVKALGDQDIMLQAAEFTGLYYYHQGKFREALDNFELVLQRAESGRGRPVIFLLPHWLGLSAAYSGQFHRAIGVLDCHWHRARQRGETILADNLRADLGIVLLMIRKIEEGKNHLQAVLEEATENNNSWGLYTSRMGLAYYHFLNNRTRKAHQIAAQAIPEADQAGLMLRQYTWTWFMEMVYDFDRLGYEPIPNYDFGKEIIKLEEDLNVQLQGVAFRLKAKQAMDRGGALQEIMAVLEESEKCLKRSGNPIELAKTWAEMARLRLLSKNKKEARRLAYLAWESLSGFSQEIFPDGLRPLLGGGHHWHRHRQTSEILTDQFADIMENLIPINDLEAFFRRLLLATGKFFGAERGGIFWTTGQGVESGLRLRVGYNLSAKEAESESFRSNLSLILKAFKTNQPISQSYPQPGKGKPRHKTFSLLCLPFQIQGKVNGVLYHDNSYYDNSFGELNRDEIKPLVRQLGYHIERMSEYFRIIKQASPRPLSGAVAVEPRERWAIEYQSPVMGEILQRADQVADTDATVLIMGETGVGKELLARRIHNSSPRRDSALHIMDVNNIPEGLLESELFGHEKGAFTGAQSQRSGRLEMADQGTLFIDEVGNIPLPIQAKLLRALQERTFFRVGGSQMFSSDFRLIAATNLDLAHEVAKGRFREDLFYRLNVVPIVIPPLRDRGDDVSLLARHFLKFFARKHQKSDLAFSQELEKELLNHSWPGNVRELKNLIERSVVFSSSGEFRLSLPPTPHNQGKGTPDHLPSLDEMQRDYIAHVLKKTNGRIGGPGGAAEILGLKRTTLYSKIKQLGISKPHQ